MTNYFLKELKPLIEQLMKDYVVIAPVKKENHFDYAPLDTVDEFKLGYVNTLYPPKKFLLPYEETLFSIDKSEMKPVLNKTKRVLFGMRPCDIHGIKSMDSVFMKDPVDPFYKTKRENTIIVGLECEKAGEDCYCTSFGTDKVEDGFDLLITPVNDGFILRSGSKKGNEIIKAGKYKKTDRDEHKYPKSQKFKIEKLDNYDDYYQDKLWKSEAERCLSCAACTVVCPTCTCFTMEDEALTPDKGFRKRKWASCQLKSFTEVAGGHTFRKEVYKRLRHFAYHKLHWSKEQYGERMCVGCGRCVTACPVHINIFRITNNLGGNNNGK